MKKIIFFLFIVLISVFLSCKYSVSGGEQNEPSPVPEQESKPEVKGYIQIENTTTSKIYIYEEGDSFRTRIKAVVEPGENFTIDSKVGVVTYYYSFMIDVGGTLIPWHSTESAFSVQVKEDTIVNQQINFPQKITTKVAYLVIKNVSGSAIRVTKGNAILSPVDNPEVILINSGEKYVYEIEPDDFDKKFYIKNAIGTESYLLENVLSSESSSKVYEIEFNGFVKLVDTKVFSNVSYSINHYKENLKGFYDLAETETGYGLVGNKTNAVAKEYLGFNSPEVEQDVISEECDTVVEIYYERNFVTVTFDANGGEFTDSTSEKNVQGKYESLLKMSYVPTKTGYSFVKWSDSFDSFPASDVLVEAVWSPVKYDITYNLYGGTNDSGNPSSYNIESSFLLKNPERRGYRFDGWYADSSYTKKVISIDSGSTGKKFLYAKWILEVYFINYDLNGDNEDLDNPTEYTIYTETIPLKVPEKKGYTFGGWYEDSAFTKPITQVAGGTTGNKTLYAKWNPITYSITYNLNGGINNAKNPSSYTKESNSITFASPERKGYEFAGWYEDSGFTVRKTSLEAGSFGSVTLYAKWNLLTYSITYNLNGGTNNSENLSTYTVESSTILFREPSKTGYTFGGWYENSAFTKQITQVVGGTTGNKTLYAKWNPLTYSITYNLNGGTNSASNPSSYTKESSAITFTSPEKKGYEFAGWYEDSGFTVRKTSLEAGSFGNVTLYAKWNPVNYSITYNLNGGTNNNENLSTYTVESATIILGEPSKSGYTFGGWYEDSAFTKPITQVAGGTTGNKTLYAKWNPVTYTIIYNLNGGTNNNGNPAFYTIESSTILFREPSKTGYTFGGWYEDSVFTKKITHVASGTTGNKTFYAKWNPVNYSITYNLNGGTNNNENPASYTIESSTILLKEPSKFGYTFGGWYGDSVFTEKVTQITGGAIGNKTLFARWIPNNLAITVTLPENNQDISGIEYSLNDGIVQLKAPDSYLSYSWYFDDVKKTETTSVYSVDTTDSSVRAGVHFVMVVVKDSKGKSYSAQMQVAIRK